MKIKLKLRLGYAAMFIFIIAMALIGLVNLSNLNDRFSELTKQSYPKVEISNSLLRKLDKVANLASEKYNKDVSNQFKINKLNEEIASGIEKLKSNSSNNSEETELISKIANSRISFESLLNNYFNLLNSGSPEAVNYYTENIAPLFKNYEVQIDELIEKEQALLASSTIESESKYTATKTWIIGLFILILLVSGGISFWLSKNITNPIKKASDLANALAEGDFKFDVTDVSNDETGELINSMRKMKGVIANLISELDRVGDAALSGKLSVRADAGAFKGDYAKLANSYNSSLDAVISPLNLTATYIDCLSKGEVPSKITEDYKGDFNEIKVNINQMIDNFNLFIDEIKLFSKNHKIGEIDFYMNEAKFAGVYKQMAQVSNDAVKLHVDNILGILGILKSYSEGDFSSNLHTLPGKQIIANEIMDMLKANITDVIKAINANSAEQEAGDIEAYINTDKFNGAYKEMCAGYNACVRQIHGSIGKILMMTDRYASGDYSEKLEQLPGKQIIGNVTLDKLRNNILGLINSINETSAKQAAGDTDAFIDTTLFAGAYKEVCEGYNDCINSIHNSIIKILNVTKQYSAGNFNPVLEQLLDKQAVANTTLDNLRLNFLNVESEIVKLIRAADEGNLSVRADSSRFTGSYKGLVDGLNEMLDKIISPLNISAEYIDLISKGQIPEKITDEYKGDFNEIKININNLIETLHNVLGETETLIKAASDGQLHVRGDASKFTGVWKTVIDDVNEMIINTDGPIKDLSEILEKIAENDYTTRLQVKRRGVWNDLTVSSNKVIRRLLLVQTIMEEVSVGDLNRIEELRKMPSRGPNDKLRPAVLSMMESVRKLLDDSNTLANSFLKGDLTYRPDVTKHQGEFAGVMNGVNQTVDTLASNLRFVLNFLKQVSGGEELNVIDESGFLGEYKQIPVSINKLRNFLYDMIADTTGSAQAALNGDLSTRINLDKYPGGWNVIVKGFNDSLDVLINQFNIALGFLKRVSNGDDIELVDETGFKGEYKEMVSYINKLRTFLYRLIDDTGATAKAAVQGDLTARIDLSYYPGGWGVITGGFNSTLEALIEPIEEAIHTLEILATGDLTAKMNGEYNGDFRRIQDATNKLSYTLALLIRQIYEGVDSTANSTLEISQATDRMAVATQEQSSQTEEIAGAVEEMSRTINENASHAVKTSEIARKSGVVANEGKVVVENTISKMRDIAEVVKLSAEKIEQLGDSSKQIGEIISVIDDIADQTNLLALNAAIEAARAGEQGRGFAVVADEVRKLAERTTDATKQIAKMINSVQTETDIAVKVMKNGNTEVSAGIALADKAGDALNSILRSANEVIDMITQIASANEQQAATSEQLAQNVSMINTVTSESAIKIQEIADATEGLTALTTQLRNAVEEFKIDEISTNSKLLNGSSTRKNLAARN